MHIVFLNGSPNKDGNTVKLARTLLAGHDFETVNLVDYKVYEYGQHFDDDQYDEVMAPVKAADVLVVGCPDYWHGINGMLKNWMDRQYGDIQDELEGKTLYFIFQGSAPTREVLDMSDYTMKRYASLYGLDYKGMITNRRDAEKLADNI